jgi:hypothetical protein
MPPKDVILIADRRYGKRLDRLSGIAAIWIVDSPDNHPAIQARWAAHDGDVTSYRDNFQLSPDEAAAGMIGTIVEHHPLSERLTIIGVTLTPVLAATIASFGFALEADAGTELRFARTAQAAEQALDTTLALARIMATAGTRERPHAEERIWWFAQRRYLPGWGMPVCWQGWAVVIVYGVLLVGPAPFISRIYGRHPPLYVLAYAGALTAAFFAVVAAKGERSR